MRVGRCPQPPLLAVAPAARPERLVAAHGRHVDVWQLGAALSRTEQVRPERVFAMKWQCWLRFLVRRWQPAAQWRHVSI